MTKKDKIQHLLITHLLDEGQITINLPNGMTLSMGVTKEGKHGLEKTSDYCWIIAHDEINKRSINLNSYDLTLEFAQDRLMFEDNDGARRIVNVI